jgi:hypothetical protein
MVHTGLDTARNVPSCEPENGRQRLLPTRPLSATSLPFPVDPPHSLTPTPHNKSAVFATMGYVQVEEREEEALYCMVVDCASKRSESNLSLISQR